VKIITENNIQLWTLNSGYCATRRWKDMNSYLRNECNKNQQNQLLISSQKTLSPSLHTPLSCARSSREGRVLEAS